MCEPHACFELRPRRRLTEFQLVQPARQRRPHLNLLLRRHLGQLAQRQVGPFCEYGQESRHRARHLDPRSRLLGHRFAVYVGWARGVQRHEANNC